MSDTRRLKLSPVVAATAVVSTLLVGAGGMYLLIRSGRLPATAPAHTAAAPAPNEAQRQSAPSLPRADDSSAPLPDLVVTLTKEAANRAGIAVAPISTQTGSDRLRVPGVIEPNAYRQVAVTPLVGGRIVRVSAQLGDRVRKGQSIAQVYSPELAEARTKFVAARAMLDAHDRELQRAQKLVEIGAASRQELERIHAEHAAQTAEVESARSRLQLLGAEGDGSAGSDAQESATTTVPAPIDGIVTERSANVGLNVDPSTKLFTIVDLSDVWIVADVYERDLHRIREGMRATVTTTGYPDVPLAGRVSFIDPQLNATTRTARIRVAVANPRGILRLGMYTDVAIESAGATPVITVPKDAIQSVGDRQVVYLASPNGPSTFVEREVRLGHASSDRVEVLAGLSASDSVVSTGSFFVRAEVERLGLRGSRTSSPASGQAAGRAVSGDAAVARIVVTEKGFEPGQVSVRAGVAARITFVRTTDKTCATEVVFPSLNIKRALPLNEPVVIEFTPAKTGDIAFACGMNMLKGVVVVVE